MPRASPPTGTILDVPVAPITREGLLEVLVRAARSRTGSVIFYANAHAVLLARRQPEFLEALRAADLVYPDGWGAVLVARLRGQRVSRRMTAADYIEPFCQRFGREGLRLFIAGGRPGVAAAAALRLRRRVPGLRVVGIADGYEGAEPGLLPRLQVLRPDLLLVGMGSPRQERWILENREHLASGAIWAVGGLFDFVSGRLRRGPRFAVDHGLEWLCRLCIEPRRLWRRYLPGGLHFTWEIGRALLLRHRASRLELSGDGRP